MRERGSTSAVILGFLLFLSVLFAATYMLSQFTMNEIKRSNRREEKKEILLEEAQKVVDIFLEDPEPEVDSLMDPVWSYIKDSDNRNIHIELEDISSKFGINWIIDIDRNILAHSELLKPDKTLMDFGQFRYDTGLHLNMIPDFTDFFEEDDLEKYFTTYSYFNINICDEQTLEQLYIDRTGDADEAKEFRERVRTFRQGSKPKNPKMIEPAQLEGFLGPNRYDKLFPLLIAEPVINIHFVPEDVLYTLFTFEHHDVPEYWVQHFVEFRKKEKWDLEELDTLIIDKKSQRIYKKTFLHHYIGVKTWFWEMKIKINDDPGNTKLRWIISRIPQKPIDQDKVEYRLIEEEWLFED